MTVNLKALVVDDEFEVRRFVANLLTTQLGFSKVTEAQSAEIALKMLQAGEKFDLLFSDWEMARMKGDEFLQEIRNNPETKKIPFIMMSYKKDKESLVKAIQLGVTNYLVKPLTAGSFIQKVKKTITDLNQKALEDFKAKLKNPVDLTLSENEVVPGSLLHVTDAGCTIRTPVFKRGLGCVYDTIWLEIKYEGSIIKVETELVSLKEDHVDVSTRMFVVGEFKFRDMDQKIAGKIERLVTNFHVQKLDDVKSPPPQG